LADDGTDTGRGTEFLEGLSKTIGDRTLTIFEGGTATRWRWRLRKMPPRR